MGRAFWKKYKPAFMGILAPPTIACIIAFIIASVPWLKVMRTC
jgi:hypothetical protein